MICAVMSYFNSIKVRLERNVDYLPQNVSNNFNSIKVRLEHPYLAMQNDGSIFQFHKGAIRTYCSICSFCCSTISIP